MTETCIFCNGTGKEDGHPDCVWCDNTGKTGHVRAITAATHEAFAVGTGLVEVSPEGVRHVPLKDTLVNLKPFKRLPYGARFRYQGTKDVWVRTGHNLVAEWPSRVSGRDGVPIQSLCSFCHLDGDEDGTTLDTPVEVVDLDAELAALREDLVRIKRISDNYYSLLVDANQSLTAAEQRNAEALELLAETSKAILRHQAEQPMSHRIAGLLTKARSKVDRYLKANHKSTESGASE